VSHAIPAVRPAMGRNRDSHGLDRHRAQNRPEESCEKTGRTLSAHCSSWGPWPSITAMLWCNPGIQPPRGGLWERSPTPGETDERFCGSFKLFRPDGTFMPHEQCPHGRGNLWQNERGARRRSAYRRPNGSRVTVIVNIRPLTNHAGEVTEHQLLLRHHRAQGSLKSTSACS